MKKIFIFCFIFACYVSAAQKKQATNPGADQMEKAMKELEKEDPEMAKKMRKVMNQSANPDNVPSKNSSTGQAADGFITPVKLSGFKIPTEAESRDHLFWYKGKKANDSTLITSKGWLIQFRKKINKIVVQPDSRKDPFARMISGMKNTEARKDQFIDMMMKTRNGYLSYPWVKEGLDAMDEVQHSMGQALKNVLEPPVIPGSDPGGMKMGKGGFQFITEVPDWIIRDQAEVQAFITSKTRDTWFYIPPPPIQNFDFCTTCDTAKTNEYIRKKDGYVLEFAKNEREVIQKALAIMCYAANHENQPALKPYAADMEAAVEKILDYLTRKSRQLVKQYGKDFNRMSAIINVLIGLERQKQLSGLGEDNAPEMFDYITTISAQLEPYVDRLILEKDYSQLMDIRWIINFIRQKQLAGSADDDTEFGRLITKVTNFNRFRLTIEMKSKMVRARDENGAVIMTADADLKGEDYFSLIPVGNCKLKLLNNKRSTSKKEEMSAEESLNAIAFPMVLLSAHATDGSFIGPSQWVTVAPVINPSFCSSPDTMMIMPAAPRSTYGQMMAMKPVEEKWNLKDVGVTSSNIVGQLLSDGFPDHESGEMEEMDESEAISQLLGGLNQTNDKLSTLEFKFRALKLEARVFTPQVTGMFFVIGEIHNKTGLVFNEKMDGKENNEHADDIISSTLSVKLEHDPFENE